MFNFILITSQYWQRKMGAVKRIIRISSWDCRSTNKSFPSLQKGQVDNRSFFRVFRQIKIYSVFSVIHLLKKSKACFAIEANKNGIDNADDDNDSCGGDDDDVLKTVVLSINAQATKKKENLSN